MLFVLIFVNSFSVGKLSRSFGFNYLLFSLMFSFLGAKYTCSLIYFLRWGCSHLLVPPGNRAPNPKKQFATLSPSSTFSIYRVVKGGVSKGRGFPNIP